MKLFITGISSGLGLGIAQIAQENGASIWAMNRKTPRWTEGRKGIHFESVDFAQLENIKHAVDHLFADCEQLDLVILNSGKLCKIQDMRDTSMSQIEDLMNINVWANKILLDSLFKRGISIKQVVGISSGASINGNRGWNAYSLSKCTLNMLIKLYAEEVPETHFTSLAPGLIDSPMQNYLCGLPQDDRYKALEILKSAKNTDRMPDSMTAGRIIWNAIPKLLNYPSGSYVDVREM